MTDEQKNENTTAAANRADGTEATANRVDDTESAANAEAAASPPRSRRRD